MKNQITIREANSKTDTAAFWEQLRSYHERDIFPNPKDESLKHFLNDAEYRAQIEHVHNRPQDNCYYLFFQRNGQDIGFALPVIFTSEDGKCFIMEFCVYPEFRGNGTGRAYRDGAVSACMRAKSSVRTWWNWKGIIKRSKTPGVPGRGYRKTDRSYRKTGA